ncbi:RNA polymerase binding protein RbpA [Haloactinospora alba]|uniref:RNA polymerase-binding protein RbpA n=1 Tax=Haloactinospora alba TaxID=405555 RepID=A0A543NIC1_9ACTN|nr:RNA polymerase-binding protein RbpA [Haloactinospora alba]TQN31585.1 RNA polymerase binding protein RbpA [Haloactinospora alba]
MAERALRGTRLGATSYENDRNTDLAPRQEVTYDCPQGHRFSVTFASEAEIPTNWECRFCGENALIVDGNESQEKKAKPARTHWDMLLERRSMEDLEEVLNERLELLRARRREEAEHMQAMDEERQSA